MMKYTSKWAYLLGLPLLACVFTLCFMNVANGNISIVVPLEEKLHRSNLHSLFLGITGTEASIKVNDGKLNILNGLIMGHNNEANVGASFVTIGGGRNNKIAFVEKSGIGGGNNNEVYTSYSAIGGGSSNSAIGGSTNAIAGGQNNQTSSGGTVVGGESNIVSGRGIVVGGESNMLRGDNSMVLGSNSKGGQGSFSRNSPIIQDYSAIIIADSGVLIGTYEPVTGVNLVVNGGVKIGTVTSSGSAGEIRMMSGCFYGYDGLKRHLISKQTLSDECPDVTCAFGATLYKGGEVVTGYLSPYSEDCSSELVYLECNAIDGTLGDGRTYYPSCYNLGSSGVVNNGSMPTCGGAHGGTYSDAPTDGLCEIGNPSAVVQGSNGYTWTCSDGVKTVACRTVTPEERCKNANVIWNNDKFLDENFWALRGGNPTDCDIISALYGSNSSDTTAYTVGRSGWQWGVNCDVLNLDVVHVTTNNQIGNTLQKNTIYVLDVDNIQSDIGFTSNGNCIAVISRLPSGSKVLTYRSDDYQANIYPWSFSILDNLSVDGVFNADGAKHGRNHHGINVWGAYNTLNNVNVYNAGHGIVTSQGRFHVFNNMKIYNNDGDGIRLIGSDYSSFNNMQIFNNRDAGIKWSSTRPTHYNLFNNIQTYNNGVGIDITSVSTNNKFNNVRVFNNNQSVINSNSTNTYNGLLDVFGNGSNGYGLTAASAQYGWTAGVQGSNSNGWSLWDLMTNPMSAGGNYLLNMGGSYGNARQVKSYILIDGYSYGNWILKQTQPVAWKGGNVIPVGNYDGSKFIGSM